MENTVKVILKNAEIFSGDQVETVDLKNPCQMWKRVPQWRDDEKVDRVIVYREDGTIFKDFTRKVLKNGKANLVNSVHETNRWMTMKANGKITLKGKERIAVKAPEAHETPVIEDPIAIKKAKKAAYDKARRARLKAEKEAASKVA